MNNFCVDLIIPFAPLKDGFDFEKLKRTSHSKIDPEDLNPNLIEFADKFGLTLHLAECFYSNPLGKKFSQIHRDVSGAASATKFNWSYGGGGSLMNWFIPITDIERLSTTAIGVRYRYYNNEDVKLIHSQPVGFPSLLEVALPHNVTIGNKERICVSILFKYKYTDFFPTFSEAVELFKDYIK